MVNKKVLLVEDDPEIRATVRAGLEQESIQVEFACDGREGLEKASQGEFDALILDVNLPHMSGLEVCRALRAEGRLQPVLMLTARSDEIDKVLGLELGADDYVTKPFSMRELVARVKALLRRGAQQQSTEEQREEMTLGPLRIDFRRTEAFLNGEQLNLTPIEFDLLRFFVENSGRTITREMLMQELWGYEAQGYAKVVSTHMSRLRCKLEPDAGSVQFIYTVRGVGYRFAEAHEVERGSGSNQ